LVLYHSSGWPSTIDHLDSTSVIGAITIVGALATVKKSGVYAVDKYGTVTGAGIVTVSSQR